MRYLLFAVAVLVCLAIGCSSAEAGGRVQVLRDQFGRRVVIRNGRVLNSRRFVGQSRFRGQVFRSRGFGRQRVFVQDSRPVIVRDRRVRRGFGVELFRDRSLFGSRSGFRIGF